MSSHVGRDGAIEGCIKARYGLLSPIEEGSGMQTAQRVGLDLSRPVWDRFLMVAPLVIVGSREGEQIDFAPKHMVIPFGWENRIGFVCAPHHHTYQNIRRERSYTVTYLQPDDVLMVSLSSSPRCSDDSKPALRAIPSFESKRVAASYPENGSLFFGLELEQIIDGFGRNSLIVGHIVEAMAHPDALLVSEGDDRERLSEPPLLAYVSPGYYAKVDCVNAFPFAEGWKK